MDEEENGRPRKKPKNEEGQSSSSTDSDAPAFLSEILTTDEPPNHNSWEFEEHNEVGNLNFPVFSSVDSDTDNGGTKNDSSAADCENEWTEQDQQGLEQFKDSLKSMDVSALLETLHTYDPEGYQTPDDDNFRKTSFEAVVEETSTRFFLKNCTCTATDPALMLSEPSRICSCGRSIQKGDLRIRLDVCSCLHENFLQSCARFVHALQIFKSDVFIRPIYRCLFLAVHWKVLDQIRARSEPVVLPPLFGNNPQTDYTLKLTVVSSVFCICCYADQKSPEELVREFLDPSIAALVETGWPHSKVMGEMLCTNGFHVPPHCRQRVLCTMEVLQRRAVTRFDSADRAVAAFTDRDVVRLAWEFFCLLFMEAKFFNHRHGIDCARLKSIINFICRFNSIGRNLYRCGSVSVQGTGNSSANATCSSAVSDSAFRKLEKLFDSTILQCGGMRCVFFEDENFDGHSVSSYPKLDFDTEKVEALSHVFLIVNTQWDNVTFAIFQHSLFGTMLSLLNWVKRYVFSAAQTEEKSPCQPGSGKTNQEEEVERQTDDSALFLILQKNLQNEGHTVFLKKLEPLFKRLCSTKKAVYKDMVASGVKMWQKTIGEASDW